MESAQMCRNVQNFYFYEYGDINDVGANIQIYLIDAKKILCSLLVKLFKINFSCIYFQTVNFFFFLIFDLFLL